MAAVAPITAVIAALERQDCRRQGRDWTCPAHEDRSPSLTVTEGDDGRVLMHCHGGCDTADILARLELTAGDLFEPTDTRNRVQRDVLGPAEVGNGNGRREIVATYDYTDSAGQLLFQVVRFAPKDFRQRRPDGHGGWEWRLGDVERVLYRLPKVLAAVETGKTIYVCEGERDVAALELAAVVATTNPGGAGKWRPEHSTTLAGANVVVIADGDEPGRKHAQAVKQSLAGRAKTVRIVEAAHGKDAADHLGAGHGIGDFREIDDETKPAETERQPARSAGELLADVGDLLQRFVVLPSPEALSALQLFVLHTWAIASAHATLYVAIVSAEKQSGKTRLLEVLALVVRAPWHTASTTEAALFRRIEQTEPTLLLDEIDAIFGSNTERTEPLRACLNAGNRRGAGVARCVGKGAEMEVKDFSVFCPKIIAGIDTGKLPETIRDRAVVLHMQRRRDGEHVQRLRYRFAAGEAEPLRADLETWAAQAADGLRDAVPVLPDNLSDRQADAWEPLFAIADLAGGEWPKRARDAAVTLSAEPDDGASRGALLLGAIRDAMGDAETIATADLLSAINANDDLPFGGWSDGKGLDARSLGRLLRPYGLKPRTIRVGDHTAKGYRRDGLQDAWARYLPTPIQPSHPSHPSHHKTSVTENPHSRANVTDVTAVTANAGVREHHANVTDNRPLAEQSMGQGWETPS